MEIRPARKDELDWVCSFYWKLIEAMDQTDNTVLWKKDIYPTTAMISDFIDNNQMYVLGDGPDYSACLGLNSRCNEGYNGLCWKIDCKPDEVLIPHILGVAADMQNKGIGKIIVRDIFEVARNSGKKAVRLDIVSINSRAEHLYLSMGFDFIEKKQMFYEDTGWMDFSMFEYVL